jgi:hypothetical protein
MLSEATLARREFNEKRCSSARCFPSVSMTLRSMMTFCVSLSLEGKYPKTQPIVKVDGAYHTIPHFIQRCLPVAVLIFFIAIYLDDKLVPGGIPEDMRV